ncbi:heterokaryon incompatibility protein-domain-containing protein [Cladorrhinum sp. PSN332]|nr:heterokaryon incompatibility protein-domain-containing protein [Cladorrhinum sp. PSN332]
MGDTNCEVRFTISNFQKHESIPSSLCAWCQSVRSEIQAAGEAGYSETLRLPSPQNKSCGPCRVFHWAKSWLSAVDDDYHPDDYFVLEIIADNPSFSIIQYRVSPDNPQKHTQLREMTLFRTDPGQPCPFSLFPSIPSRSLLPRLHHTLPSFTRAFQYLETCLASHSSACSPAKVSLPTRLISLTASSPPTIHLTLTHHLPCSSTRYTALSHCWGPAHLQPLTTTSTTLPSRLASISWDAIPRTFQDAIRFTLFLNINYIWIDSLCIVQDDADDWAKESMRMCDIYSGAFLTIAAGSAGDGRGGLYLRDEADLLRIALGKKQFEEPGSESEPESRFVEFIGVKSIAGHPRTETGAGEEDNSAWPLFERGWVLQERMMSPRVVYFLKDEVAWECAGDPDDDEGTGVLCECGVMEREGDLDLGGMDGGRKKEHAMVLMNGGQRLAGMEWRRLVQMYSCLKLSFGHDKLPALSGMAKQMLGRKKKNDTEVRYLAGLWSDELCSDLLWVRWALRSGYHLEVQAESEGNGVGGQTSEQQRGPSWSWVKMNVRVVFPEGVQRKVNVKKREYYRVLDVSTVLQTVDPTGKVSGGSLTVEGQLFDVQVVGRISTTAGDTGLDPIELGLIISDSGRAIWEAPEDHRMEGEVVFDDSVNPLGCGRERKQPNIAIKALRLARIRTWDSGCEIPRGFGILVQVKETEYAFVLQQCVSAGEATRYRRVGMMIQTRIMRTQEHRFHDGDDDLGMWKENPSVFEFGGNLDTVNII